MAEREPGQLAYEAYAEALRSKSLYITPWEKLEWCSRHGWAAAEDAIRQGAVAPWEALLQHSRDCDAEHAGNGPFISLQHEGDDFDAPASVAVVDGSACGQGKTATEAARDLCSKLGLSPETNNG